MLGLAQQVGGDQPRIGRVVGDHEDLGRARQQVDAHAAEQLALGLGDVDVAGAHEHVDRGHAVDQPEGHRGQRLDAAKAHGHVGARLVDGVEHRGVTPPPPWGGAQPTTWSTPATLATQHGHERGREHRVAPAGHVGAHRRDRDVPVAEHHARAASRPRGRQRVALRLREAAHLVRRERDVLLELVVQLGGGALECRRPRPRSRRGPSRRARATSGGRRRSRRARCREACGSRGARTSSVASGVARLGGLEVRGHRVSAATRSCGDRISTYVCLRPRMREAHRGAAKSPTPRPTMPGRRGHAGVSRSRRSRARSAATRGWRGHTCARPRSAAKLGYIPAERGRSLSTRETGQVGSWSTTWATPSTSRRWTHLHREP